MSRTSSEQKRLSVSPDIYEGSYKDIFRFIDFNFSIFSKASSTNKVGRPEFPDQALFKSIVLKYLALNSSYRTTESIIAQDPELGMLLGFYLGETPSDSVLRRFFAKLTLKEIQKTNDHFLREIRRLGYAKGRIIALDSTPIDSYCKKVTKKGEKIKDSDARWGFATCKNGWYLGYKAQVIVDAEDYLPLYCITTPANVSDQKMVKPFIIPLKKMGYHPKISLLDAGYDSENNHLSLREQLGCVSLICPNERRNKKEFDKKIINHYKKLLYQTTLDDFIPVRKRKKEYRKCCLVLKAHKEYRKFYKMRIAAEQQFATLKKDLFLENHKLIRLKNIEKYVAMKCLCVLIITLTALQMGVPEAIRCPKYFQH